ncbi:MAG: dTDP-4-dehydrorhamnose 3,5-epimerase family protein [Firmicutes bacterium]|nr:dTDP-4-dehydrorhamnose 3,5-epimerase family protein [Bacillota bacterium]
MGKIKVETCKIEGLKVITPAVFGDERGFIPKDFAHGFVVLSDSAEFAYKCTDFYHPNDEGGLAWNDPDIGIEWPIPEDMELTISEKDQKWGGIQELNK